MEIKLLVEKGVHRGLELVKNEIGKFRIGSSPKADLALVDDEYVSREHCQIEFSAEGALLLHNGDHSGTFVNSKPVRKAFLADGDALVIGRSLVRVHLAGVALPPEPIKPSLAGIDGFELVRPLPTEGPGEIWWAASSLSDHMVTLHMLRIDFQDEQVMQRFLQESETCARLRHPGLLTFWKQGIKRNMLWFATDLTEGNTLEQYIVNHGPLGTEGAIVLMQQVMDIVVYLHQQEVVHRALRPASLRIKQHGGHQMVQLTDLGSAKCFHTEELQRITHTGECGFPIHSYTAPEVLIDFRCIDPRIDIYALGCLLYFVLTGRHPYQPLQNQDLVLAILETMPVPLFTLKPDLPPNILKVIEKAMAHDPGKRYSTVPAMRQALNLDEVNPIESLQRQLANTRENYRLIEERETEYVDLPPLDLVKKKRQLEEMIAALKARLEIAEQSQDAKND